MTASQTAVVITAVWLRRNGDHAEVLVERGGRFQLVIREHLDGPFSHICEGLGIVRAPGDALPHDAGVEVGSDA